MKLLYPHMVKFYSFIDFSTYSIAETAKANNLKPFDYFEYLLTEIPKHAEDKNTDFLTEFLPWSKSLLEHIRKSKKAVEK